jgi:alkylation response protein AidB-like acyl-CoA dehydrogenase
VNGHAASFLVVPAQLPGGIPVICGVQLNQAGVIQSKSIPQLGLRGAAARNILFSSVVVTEGSFYCQGALATSTLQNAFGMLGWGVIGMLSGLIAKALAEAKDYAGLRMQGGRRIIDHRPVAELLSVACSAEDLLKSWVNQLGELGDSDTPPQPPLKEAGRTAIRATEATLQVFGGNGYICPGIAERCWRDARQAAALCSEAGCPCE